MRSYGKGKDRSFEIYATVETDVEVKITVRELFEHIIEDDEALQLLKEMLVESGVFPKEVFYTNDTALSQTFDTALSQALRYLDERSFELSDEDEKAIIEIAEKYRFIPINRW
jgi:predicted solute-binding protein